MQVLWSNRDEHEKRSMFSSGCTVECPGGMISKTVWRRTRWQRSRWMCPTVIAAAITSQTSKSRLPTHINIDSSDFGLMKNSVILTEQIRTIDKSRLMEKIGQIDEETMIQVNSALGISFGLV